MIGLTPNQLLFDFGRSHWVKMYEMLDLDAEGEEDVGVDVDDNTGDVLMG